MNDFIESQLAVWDEARERYHNLGKTERRRFRIGDFEGAFQCNPARIVSTGARVEAGKAAERKCPLCAENRPEQQTAIPLAGRWELLLNPFPIFPVHFTIVSKDHRPQTAPTFDMLAMADMMPDLAVFYNGSKGGASVPEHAHLQAVLKSELPLLALVERHHSLELSATREEKIVDSEELGLRLPFQFFSAVITADEEGLNTLRRIFSITGFDADGRPDGGLSNVIVWKDDAGWIRVVTIPRKCHRPGCYGTGEGQMMVSPGTVDMAGIVILPREEDFQRITDADLARIYSEVAY